MVKQFGLCKYLVQTMEDADFKASIILIREDGRSFNKENAQLGESTDTVVGLPLQTSGLRSK